ncbi:MAG: hypothetical protein U1E17_00940 [Geminicoccaceae bacterium]
MALGLSAWLRWRQVILPQALRSMIPPLAGQVVLLVKHSALVSVLAIAELTTAGRNLIADVHSPSRSGSRWRRSILL